MPFLCPRLNRLVLITFEGIDGSGKSLQARRLEAHFQQTGQPCLLVREPGGAPLSEHIRRILLDGEVPVSPQAELMLFSAARPNLLRKRCVLH